MNLRVESGATPTAQAELINKCVADGAAVIGTTLAAPDVVGPTIVAAREAGVQIATFNSGASEGADYGNSNTSVSTIRLPATWRGGRSLTPA